MPATAEQNSPVSFDVGQRAVLRELETRAERAVQNKASAFETMHAATVAYRAAEQAVEEAQRALTSVKDALALAASLNKSATNVSNGWPGAMNVDVLAEIFKFSAAADAEDKNLDQDAPNARQAFVIASVSRQWRAAALATPSLWTSVQVDYYWDDLRDYLTLMLERSRVCALDVYVLSAPSKNRGRTGLGDVILGKLLQRTRTIYVHFSSDELHFATSFLALFQASMPLLERLAFKFMAENLEGLRQIPPGTHLLTQCAHLTATNVNCLALHNIRPDTLPELQRFSVHAPITDDELQMLLRTWPKLETLQVAHIISDIPPLQPSPILRCLKSLICTSKQSALPYFTVTQLPALRDLSIVCSESSFTDLHNFVNSVSQCATLRTLTLISDDDGTFSMLLQGLPNLSSLTLKRFESDGAVAFFKRWAGNTLRNPPKLEHIHICETSLSADVLQTLVSFISLRHTNAVANNLPVLQSLSISDCAAHTSYDYGLPPWIKSRLEQLVPKLHIDGGDFANDV
ncbi:hypothetical protein EXIGLDRAFT_451156 [Exidia glandulosa HHB12029]|uniref:F-box domain-containing protein n=1 Tax=Exidia glandulosa HHB12029 TaxID=1314781 RepID=A0A165B3W7_EXIGL|nr:hypothetical protein EXIGLDRAFT_451156 [Exidia glandulosa HHB12029]